MSAGEVWRLVRGAELLGEIVVEEADFPWLSGKFLPQAGFADVRELFDAELALIESDVDSAIAEWERIYQRIVAVVGLESPRGPVPEFLLHVRGDEAWFRWSEEPFGE